MRFRDHQEVKERWVERALVGAIAVLLPVVAPTASMADKADKAVTTFDSLLPVESKRVSRAYLDPNADFSVFRRIVILDPVVAFRTNWQRDHNRANRSNRVRSSDMERIKKDVASLFKEVFTERLSEGGFEITVGTDDDVLVLRPAIIDLSVSAPATGSAGTSRTYTTSTGAATLVIELFDSVSGQIIGRGVDRRAIRSPDGSLTWSNRVTNRADVQRIFRRWADTLLDFLRESHVPTNPDHAKDG